MDLLPLKLEEKQRLRMMATSIRTLKPNVSQDEALRKFASIGLGALYRRLRIGPLRRIAGVYVPFFLYRVGYQLGRAPHTRFFAIDGVDGSLDLFEFPNVPGNTQLVELDTRNVLRSTLSEQHAEKLLADKVQRVIFQQGFFRLRDYKLQCTREPVDLHLPYWLAFYGDDTARCRVMDAVRRRIEGAKASAFFEEWLAA
jgi:hypothetical protein